jgi:hypothetical protein
MVINYSLYQIVTIIIMNYLDELEEIYKEELFVCRMEDLDEQHDKIREYHELSTEYAELIDQIEAMDEKKLSKELFYKLVRLVTLMVNETEKFHYLAGLNDAKKVFDDSFRSND